MEVLCLVWMAIPGGFQRRLHGQSKWASQLHIHIATPYPDTAFYWKMKSEGRILTEDWDLYDTRHVTFRPKQLSEEELKRGYDWAYREFYRWSSILQSSLSHGTVKHQLKHFFYTSGWRKFESLWNIVIQLKKLNLMTPLLEGVLSDVTKKSGAGLAQEVKEQRTLTRLPFQE
jgi:hypothetical protein